MTDPDVVTEQRLADDPPPRARDGWAARLRLRPRRRWCWGTRLVVTTSLAWLLFVILHRLLSGRTWLWTLLDLVPPLMFVAVPAALLVVAPLARPVRWRIMAVQVISGLLGASLSGINLATVWYAPPPAPPGAITMVSWNTEFWDQNWSSSGRKDAADLYRYLRELNADVYQLHEYLHLDDHGAVRIDLLPQLRREFPAHHIAVAGELITLSRFPIVQQRGLDLRPWLPDEQKAVPSALTDFPDYYITKTLRTDVLVNGTTISFYNGHVHQPPTWLSLYSGETRRATRHLDNLRQASFRALQADIGSNHHPVVVGADLNSSSAMGMRQLLPDRLVDHTRALSSIYPATWKAEGIELWRIDWLLTTPDVAVHRYDMLGPDGLSDHRAQRAILSVQP